jgi:DNA topoisomerase-3
MGLTVIIAEKHLMAVDISKAIGATEKHDGYYRNSKGTCVTWAIGHLADLAEPERYGWGKWTMDTLPMIPDKFILELSGMPIKKDNSKSLAI